MLKTFKKNTNKKKGRRREVKGGKMQKKYIYIKEVRKCEERQKRENKRKDEANKNETER